MLLTRGLKTRDLRRERGGGEGDLNPLRWWGLKALTARQATSANIIVEQGHNQKSVEPKKRRARHNY